MKSSILLFFYPNHRTGATLKLTAIDYKENEDPVTPFAYVEEIKNGQHINQKDCWKMEKPR